MTYIIGDEIKYNDKEYIILGKGVKENSNGKKSEFLILESENDSEVLEVFVENLTSSKKPAATKPAAAKKPVAKKASTTTKKVTEKPAAKKETTKKATPKPVAKPNVESKPAAKKATAKPVAKKATPKPTTKKTIVKPEPKLIQASENQMNDNSNKDLEGLYGNTKVTTPAAPTKKLAAVKQTTKPAAKKATPKPVAKPVAKKATPKPIAKPEPKLVQASANQMNDNSNKDLEGLYGNTKVVTPKPVAKKATPKPVAKPEPKLVQASANQMNDNSNKDLEGLYGNKEVITPEIGKASGEMHKDDTLKASATLPISRKVKTAFPKRTRNVKAAPIDKKEIKEVAKKLPKDPTPIVEITKETKAAPKKVETPKWFKEQFNYVNAYKEIKDDNDATNVIPKSTVEKALKYNEKQRHIVNKEVRSNPNKLKADVPELKLNDLKTTFKIGVVDWKPSKEETIVTAPINSINKDSNVITTEAKKDTLSNSKVVFRDVTGQGPKVEPKEHVLYTAPVDVKIEKHTVKPFEDTNKTIEVKKVEPKEHVLYTAPAEVEIEKHDIKPYGQKDDETAPIMTNNENWYDRIVSFKINK